MPSTATLSGDFLADQDLVTVGRRGSVTQGRTGTTSTGGSVTQAGGALTTAPALGTSLSEGGAGATQQTSEQVSRTIATESRTAAQEDVRRDVVWDSDFLKKQGPLYEAFVQKRHAQALATVSDLDKTLAVLYHARAEIDAQRTALAAIGRFFGDPLGLITSTLAAFATSGGSLAVDILKRTVQAAKSPDDAYNKVQGQIEAIVRQRNAKLSREFIPKSFALLDTLPAGVHVNVTDAHGRKTLVGKGPLPADFLDWYKRRKK